jgi:hypothetical protein
MQLIRRLRREPPAISPTGLDAAAERAMREKLAWFAEHACSSLPLA